MSKSYYNEIDPFAAAWLRELIKAGLIADGEVDERSIADVTADDVRGFTQCHWFAGIGGWSYALRLAGWPDDREVWTGSCPCQPFSMAGDGGGTGDSRHLWPTWYRLIGECQPATVFGEQVASADGLYWLDLVYVDLEAAGYAVGAVDLAAASVGAFHRRQRLYFVADASGVRAERLSAEREVSVSDNHRCGETGELADADESVASHGGLQRSGGLLQSTEDAPVGFWADADWIACVDGKARPVEPGTFPLAHGVSARVGRLRGYGNAIVPQVAQAFIEAYMSIERDAAEGALCPP